VSLLALFDRAVADGFIKPPNRGIVIADADPGTLVERLAQPLATVEGGVIRPEET